MKNTDEMSNCKIKRYPLSGGTFSTIHNSVLSNQSLTIEAKILLIHFLNQSDNWTHYLGYYSKLYKWNRNKQSRIINNLKQNGFVKSNQISMGKGKGFRYEWEVSEFGDLSDTAAPDNSQIIQEPPINREWWAGHVEEELPKEPKADIISREKAEEIFNTILERTEAMYWVILSKFRNALRRGEISTKSEVQKLINKELKNNNKQSKGVGELQTRQIGKSWYD